MTLPRDPITETPYLTVGGDSLPSIAERCGHSGEWLALADLNEGHVWTDWNNIQPGLILDIPEAWFVAPKEDTTPSTKRGSSSTLKETEKAAEDFERRHSRD